MTWTEILGFVTGAASVWLAVRESVWNWPVGIANNIFISDSFLESETLRERGSPDRLYRHLDFRMVELAARRRRSH